MNIVTDFRCIVQELNLLTHYSKKTPSELSGEDLNKVSLVFDKVRERIASYSVPVNASP